MFYQYYLLFLLYKEYIKDDLELKFMDYLEKKYKDKQIDIKTINIIDERDEFFENNKFENKVY